MIKKLQLLIIILGVLLASCFKLDEVPPLKYDGEANMTIAELQEFHKPNAEYPTTLIEDDIVITGLVISTDEFGSSYKEIYIQDETGGICIRTSNTSYYNKYRIGQRVFVEVKGLCLGNYVSGKNFGAHQLGLYGNTNGGVEFLSSKAENLHVFRHDVPQARPAPKVVTQQSDLDLPRDYHTLVRLENCRFELANGTNTYYDFSSSYSTVSRRIRFNIGEGKGIDARISQYCNFASNILPEGTLDIVGILSKFYDDTPQLIICSINDVEIRPAEKILLAFDMQSDPFTKGWTNKQEKGTTVWKYEPGSVKIQETDGKETECWLVSPKLNFAGEKDIAVSFQYRIPSGGNSDNLQVMFTVDGTNWSQFTGFVPQTGGYVEAKLKIDDAVATNPNLQVAFKYKTTDIFPLWIIRDISFKGNVTM